MKKRRLIFLILTITFALCTIFGVSACGKDGGDDDDGGSSPSTKITISFDKGFSTDGGDDYVTTHEIDPSQMINLTGSSVVTYRSGYRFLGYFDSKVGGIQIFNASGEQLVTVSSNATFYAQWEAIPYEKKFTTQSDKVTVTNCAPIIVTADDGIIALLPTPTMSEGYEFVGWVLGEDADKGILISNGASVKSDYANIAKNPTVWLNETVFSAKIKIRSYKVTLNYNDGSGKTETLYFDYNTKVQGLPVLDNMPSMKMDFSGWSTRYDKFEDYNMSPICTNIKEDITLYATWDEYKIIKFHKDITGNNYEEFKVYRGRTFTMPEVANAGYELEAWYSNKLFNTAIVETLHFNSGYTDIYGKWNPITYKMKFNLNDGYAQGGATSLSDIEYDIETTRTLPTVSKERYTFVGWTINGTDTTITSIEPGLYGDITVTAKFKGHDRKVVYNVGEGSLNKTYKNVEYGAKYTLDIPVLENAVFVGWYADEEFNNKLTDGQGVSSLIWDSYEEETEVYAKFDKYYMVRVVHSLDMAGTATLSQSAYKVPEGGENYAYYVVGESVTISITSMGKYEFASIYEGGFEVSTNREYVFTMTDNAVELTVNYDVKKYTVTLNKSGGYCKYSTVQVRAGEYFTLPIPLKQGNKFYGWELKDYDFITNNKGESTIPYDFERNITVDAIFRLDPNETDIYVSSVSGLKAMKDKPGATYQLVADIDMAGQTWTPFEFSGILNGNGYSISNFTIEEDEGNLAMFTKLKGTVDGLTFRNVNITSYNYNGVGISVICYNLEGGTINDCTIESGKIEGEIGLAGGFAAYVTSGTITNCVNKANIEIDTTHTSDSYSIGGIAGFVKAGTITDCKNYGTIKGAEFVGGIVGRSQGSNANITLTNLENHGNVVGTDSFVAGIIGRFDRDYEYSIKNLKNTAQIEGVNYVGGLFGYWENAYTQQDSSARKVTATGLINSGDIISEGNYVGGLIGRVYFDAPYNSTYSNSWNGTIALIIKESKNTGDIEGGLYVGGLIGSGVSDTSVSVIENAINVSKVTAKARVGAIAGELSIINLKNPSNTGSTVSATETHIDGSNKYAFLGGYVGRAENSNIEGAINTCEINYSSTSCEGSYVGGITGWSSGTFTDCKNNAKINAPKSNCVGGISGELSKTFNYTIKNVENKATINGNNYVAGIFGTWYDNYTQQDSNARVVNAINFINSGKITGANNYVGGLMGYTYFDAPYNSTYSNSWDGSIALVMRTPKNTGDVEGVYYVGGLIGKISTDSGTSMIEQGVNKSNVKATAIVGAIAGETSTIKLVETSNANSTVTATGTYDESTNKYAYVGGYIGKANSTNITTALNEVEIDYSTTLCVGSYVGGITGYSSGTFEDCVNNANVYAPKSNYVGGISGRLNKAYNYKIISVTNTSNITGVSYVAGIFGDWNNTYTIQDSNARMVDATTVINSGNIKGTGNYVGGLVGNSTFDAPYNSTYSNSWNGTIGLMLKQASNTGDVEGVYYVGGLFGRLSTDSGQTNVIEATSVANVKGTAIIGGLFGEANIVKLTATSNEGSTVTATGTYDESTNKYAYFGGYIGKALNVTISDSTNNVEIDYSDTLCIGYYVGGFCGYSEGVFTNCTNNADVYAPNSCYVGGIAGRLNRAYAYTIENVTNNGDVSGINYVAGIFGDWTNNHTTQDSSVRRVDANDIINNGNITATGNYVAGLVGKLYFDAPYNSTYSSSWNGQQMLYMKGAVNTGDVEGISYVGGLMGYCHTDSSTSEIFTLTQEGVITGTTNIEEYIGYVENLKLPVSE